MQPLGNASDKQALVEFAAAIKQIEQTSGSYLGKDLQGKLSPVNSKTNKIFFREISPLLADLEKDKTMSTDEKKEILNGCQKLTARYDMKTKGFFTSLFACWFGQANDVGQVKATIEKQLSALQIEEAINQAVEARLSALVPGALNQPQIQNLMTQRVNDEVTSQIKQRLGQPNAESLINQTITHEVEARVRGGAEESHIPKIIEQKVNDLKASIGEQLGQQRINDLIAKEAESARGLIDRELGRDRISEIVAQVVAKAKELIEEKLGKYQTIERDHVVYEGIFHTNGKLKEGKAIYPSWSDRESEQGTFDENGRLIEGIVNYRATSLKKSEEGLFDGERHTLTNGTRIYQDSSEIKKEKGDFDKWSGRITDGTVDYSDETWKGRFDDTGRLRGDGIKIMGDCVLSANFHQGIPQSQTWSFNFPSGVKVKETANGLSFDFPRDIYKGEVRVLEGSTNEDGKKFGKWTYVIPGGVTFTCQYKQGVVTSHSSGTQFDGYFKMNFPNGRMLEGKFENNVLRDGTVKRADGTILQGKFNENGDLIEGTITKPNGTITEIHE